MNNIEGPKPFAVIYYNEPQTFARDINVLYAAAYLLKDQDEEIADNLFRLIFRYTHIATKEANQ